MKTGETETDIVRGALFRMQTSTRVGRIQITHKILGINQRPDYEKVSSLQDTHNLQQHLPSNWSPKTRKLVLKIISLWACCCDYSSASSELANAHCHSWWSCSTLLGDSMSRIDAGKLRGVGLYPCWWFGWDFNHLAVPIYDSKCYDAELWLKYLRRDADLWLALVKPIFDSKLSGDIDPTRIFAAFSLSRFYNLQRLDSNICDDAHSIRKLAAAELVCVTRLQWHFWFAICTILRVHGYPMVRPVVP
jgi:hypothetical protein